MILLLSHKHNFDWQKITIEYYKVKCMRWNKYHDWIRNRFRQFSETGEWCECFASSVTRRVRSSSLTQHELDLLYNLHLHHDHTEDFVTIFIGLKKYIIWSNWVCAFIAKSSMNYFYSVICLSHCFISWSDSNKILHTHLASVSDKHIKTEHSRSIVIISRCKLIQ